MYTHHFTSVLPASFPLFATQIYYKLGAQGASSLLGGLLVLMAYVSSIPPDPTTVPYLY
jgi:hypothetical protein